MTGDEIFKQQPHSFKRIPYTAAGVKAFFLEIRQGLKSSQAEGGKDSLVNQAEVDAIVALIQAAFANVAEEKYYFEIRIPSNHTFDHDKILHFFSDATIYCHRGRPNVLKGTATDPNVGAYLFSKYQERTNCSQH